MIDNFVSLRNGIPRICLNVLGRDDGVEVDDTVPREALSLFEISRDLLEKPL